MTTVSAATKMAIVGKTKAVGRMRIGVMITNITSIIRLNGKIHSVKHGSTKETSTKIATTGTSSCLVKTTLTSQMKKIQSATSTIPSTTVDKTTAGSTGDPRGRKKLIFGVLKTVLLTWLALVIGMKKTFLKKESGL